MSKICRDCVNWGGNASDYDSYLCDADMYSDDPDYWFVGLTADHECHRLGDFIEVEACNDRTDKRR